jgi:hypothetical protein
VAANPVKTQSAAKTLVRNQRTRVPLPGLFDLTTLLMQQISSQWQGQIGGPARSANWTRYQIFVAIATKI